MNNQYRHGDLLIESTDSIPEDAKERKGNIVVTGANGHHHILTGGTIFDSGNDAYLKVPTAATLTHEEHNTIPLPAGNYIVIRQREYDPYEDAVRMVED